MYGLLVLLPFLCKTKCDQSSAKRPIGEKIRAKFSLKLVNIYSRNAKKYRYDALGRVRNIESITPANIRCEDCTISLPATSYPVPFFCIDISYLITSFALERAMDKLTFNNNIVKMCRGLQISSLCDRHPFYFFHHLTAFLNPE